MSTLTVVTHPIVQDRLTRLRDVDTPTPAFRRHLREVAVLLAAEATRELPLGSVRVTTPLATIDAPALEAPEPCVVSILRAGNGLLDGFLDVVPEAVVGFVGLFRDDATHRPVSYYEKLPGRLSERTVFVLDPMLATGHSGAAAVDRVKAAGAVRIVFVALIAAPEGVAELAARHPDVPVITASLDERLNEHAYIVPGLGDAGDRLFGT